MSKLIKLDTRYGRATGQGDVVLWSWLTEGSKDSDPRLMLYVEHYKRQLTDILCQETAPDPHGSILGCAAFLQDVEHGRSIPRMQTHISVMGLKCEPKRPPHHIPEEHQDWARGLLDPRRQDGRKVVLLFPQSTQLSRSWPNQNWVDLAWKLMDAEIIPIALMANNDPILSQCPTWIYGFSWFHVAAMMKEADCVIGVDSAPVHLSGTLGVNTLALLGPTTKNVFAHCPDIECISTSPFDLNCVGCNFQNPFEYECNHGCKALQMLSVEKVFRKVVRKLGC